MAREIKVATFNVEWMVNLFKNGTPEMLTKQNKGTPGLGAKPKNPQGVATRIASVIQAVDADILGICEGPPLKTQMQTFVKEKLGDIYTVYSMQDGPQSIHVLVHKRLEARIKASQPSESDKVFERLRTVRLYHKFGNVKVTHKGQFTRLPVVLRLERKDKITEIMALHTKSKISDLKKARDWKIGRRPGSSAPSTRGKSSPSR